MAVGMSVFISYSFYLGMYIGMLLLIVIIVEMIKG